MTHSNSISDFWAIFGVFFFIVVGNLMHFSCCQIQLHSWRHCIPILSFFSLDIFHVLWMKQLKSKLWRVKALNRIPCRSHCFLPYFCCNIIVPLTGFKITIACLSPTFPSRSAYNSTMSVLIVLFFLSFLNFQPSSTNHHSFDL